MSLDNVKHIVLVLSGKGGVGKSSITTQLALSLSLAGHSVGILDIDLTGPSIPRLLGLENAKITQAPGGWLPCEVHSSQTLPPIPTSPLSQAPNEVSDSVPSTNEAKVNGHGPPAPDGDVQTEEGDKIGSLHAISLALLLPSRSSAIVWRGPKKTAMVRQFLTDVLWPPTDYLLIDTPPGTSDEHISLAETLQSRCLPNQLAGAAIVTTPQAVAISDVRKEVNFCRKVGVEVLGVVENMSGYVCECCGERANLFGKGGGKVMAENFEVPFLGGVPVDRQWGVLVEEGRRPSYGAVENRGEGEEEGKDRGWDESEEGWEKTDGLESDEERKEEGLLVDRYRSCSLYGCFQSITKQLVGIVEGRSNGAV
ncbi:MAG: cytosolic Fe-S cluster assembly factor cfd1 [Alectoria fallacina]|uniref:Cytosolic Fe-S cluster assembly factor cfd1 n=1 Tax=Alectoria fallacina TaxID=1903189 RepID=A0A8H3EL33_9LECA|nr:MAG: cytosolic Fe-S cluster assembly factor cfd1 [Alectoria fallacina]